MSRHRPESEDLLIPKHSGYGWRINPQCRNAGWYFAALLAGMMFPVAVVVLVVLWIRS